MDSEWRARYVMRSICFAIENLPHFDAKRRAVTFPWLARMKHFAYSQPHHNSEQLC